MSENKSTEVEEEKIVLNEEEKKYVEAFTELRDGESKITGVGPRHVAAGLVSIKEVKRDVHLGRPVLLVRLESYGKEGVGLLQGRVGQTIAQQIGELRGAAANIEARISSPITLTTWKQKNKRKPDPGDSEIFTKEYRLAISLSAN